MSQEKKIKWLLALTIIMAVIRAIPIPAQYDYAILAGKSNDVYRFSDQVYYVANSFILFFLMWTVHIYRESLITGILVRLAFGKLFDEWISPFHSSYNEIAWNVYVVIWIANKLWKGNAKLTKLFTLATFFIIGLAVN